MKNIFCFTVCAMIVAGLFSCNKDSGLLPKIAFKTGGNYISASASKAVKSTFTIGIDAQKAESADVLKKFNVSKSVNGAASATIFSKDLSGAEGDAYSYDYSATVDSTVGQASKYTFTVTNRDGLVNQVTLTLTGQ